jgi:formate-dependent nitrite reductase membrane component NrfD
MELDSQSQSVWGWKIPAYLFLGGLGGGCYLIGALFDLFLPAHPMVAKVGVVLGPFAVLVGTFFLLADLERPALALRSFLKPGSSWIARGSIILTVFVVLGVIHTALWIWPSGMLTELAASRHVLVIVNGVLALLTIIYTGLLLGALRPIPIWCNPLLPVLFLFSGLSTALMATGLGVALVEWSHGTDSGHLAASLLSYDLILLVLEGLIVFFYLQGSHLLGASRASVRKLVRGDLALRFWVGFVLLGLALPFAVGLAGRAMSPVTSSGNVFLSLFMAVPGLVGGYLLRYLIVAGGIRIPLNVEGVMVSPLPET